MTRGTIVVLLVAFLCVMAICFLIFALARQKAIEMEKKGETREKYKGIINKLNHNEFVEQLGSIIPMGELEKIFNRAKNPWNMSLTTFQFIRYGGLTSFFILGSILLAVATWQVGMFWISMGLLCWYYPMYYYRAIGNEREMEWNKMYEFIWVIKHNIMLYDVAKAYMNVKVYLEEHAPHNTELIQGFEDFYKHWSTEEISEYVERYYPFSIPREITQILFNMNKTGEFPEEELNSLRQFIINTQDLAVEKTLSGVSSKATIFSLPFLMITVIISLMVPLVFQIINML